LFSRFFSSSLNKKKVNKVEIKREREKKKKRENECNQNKNGVDLIRLKNRANNEQSTTKKSIAIVTETRN